jgi:hypothetical protein
VDTIKARIILLEGAPNRAPSPFKERLQMYYTKEHLETVGGSRSAWARPWTTPPSRARNGVETIRTRIWAAGVQASPLTKMPPRRPARRPTAPSGVGQPRLQPARAPRRVRRGRHGVVERAAGGGPTGHAGDKYVAKLIKARTTGGPTPPQFNYFDRAAWRPAGTRPRSPMPSATSSPANPKASHTVPILIALPQSLIVTSCLRMLRSAEKGND